MFDKWKSIARKLRNEFKVYNLVLKDPRTPKSAKFLLWIAVGYALLPFDIIPDFIPQIHTNEGIIQDCAGADYYCAEVGA